MYTLAGPSSFLDYLIMNSIISSQLSESAINISDTVEGVFY